MFLILILIDLFLLYILSRFITKTLSRLIHSKIKSLHITIRVFSFFLLPGTLLHELSHFALAHVLGVRTFDFVLMPKLEEKSVLLGSVSIERTDVLRRTLIGIAPLIFGVSLAIFLLWFLTTLPQPEWWVFLLVGFAIFEICNTMFPSKADISGSVNLLLVVLCILATIFLMVGNASDALIAFGSQDIFRTGVYYLTIIIGIDIFALILLSVISRYS